ncbi:hypothetical protein [Lacrimispora xylanisolvens]|uniref:hypothetical protein n=1 Tax=Lacrimispora xylanisolvens TaxID=384636 RepID=UPI0024027027
MTMLILCATASEATGAKTTIFTFVDVILRLIPILVTIYIALRSNSAIDKRNDDTKTIAFLREGIELYSKLQVKISELNLVEDDYIFAMNEQNFEIFKNTKKELLNISEESKLWQFLQTQLYSNIKTYDVAPMVDQICNDTMRIIIDAQHQMKLNPDIKNDAFLRLVGTNIDGHFKGLDKVIIKKKKYYIR